MDHQIIRRPWAVLFDRDGTLIRDVPYNLDPSRVRPMPTAAAALAILRTARIPTGVLSNQSGIARGWLSAEQVRRVNQRVDDLLGPFDIWRFCPHQASDNCRCRKPEPGMLIDAAHALGIPPTELALIGDIGADVDAARAAGAQAVLVPTAATRPQEVSDAPLIAADLAAAVSVLIAAGDVHRKPAR